MGQECLGYSLLCQIYWFHLTVELGVLTQELEILENMIQNRFYKAKK